MSTGSGRDFVVRWHRATHYPHAVSAWWTGGCLCTFGVYLGSLAMQISPQEESWLRPGLSLLASMLFLIGPLMGLRGLRWLLSEGSLLELRGQGIYLQTSKDEFFLPWSELKGVGIQSGQLLLEGGQRPLRIDAHFEDLSPETLRDEILELRRRALLGVLRPPGD